MFESYDRDQLRQAYADAWRKHQGGRLLAPLDAMLVDVIRSHPQYEPLVVSGQDARRFEPASSQVNPFLHMGLHVAVREQLSIDRPPGLARLHGILAERYGAHGADHALMEALEETLRDATRSGRPPDEAAYIERVRARAAASHGA